MSNIDNWTIWDPSWVSIDVHEFEVGNKQEKAYQGYLNLCLEEGDIDKDDMKMITIGTNIFGDEPGYVAMKTLSIAEVLFDNIVGIIFLYDSNGAEIGSLNVNDTIGKLFQENKAEEKEMEIVEND